MGRQQSLSARAIKPESITLLCDDDKDENVKMVKRCSGIVMISYHGGSEVEVSEVAQYQLDR